MNGSVLMASFHHSSSLPYRSPLLRLPSILIDAPHKKKAIAARWPKKRKAWLDFFVHSLSIANPTGILSALLFPDHSYGFGYSSKSALSPFVFEDNVHCLKGRELKFKVKIQPERTLHPLKRSVFVTINNITPRPVTVKLLWQCRDCNFVEYLQKIYHKVSLFRSLSTKQLRVSFSLSHRLICTGLSAI